MSKKFFLVLVVAVFIAVFAFLFFNQSGFLRRIKLSSQIDSLQAEISDYKNRIDKLGKEIELLKSDSSEIEHVAREKYNFKKPNETVIDIEIK